MAAVPGTALLQSFLAALAIPKWWQGATAKERAIG